MSDSVWKKEISFRRKRDDAPSRPENPIEHTTQLAPPPPAAPQVQPVLDATEAPAQASTSVWKKEITFRRKPAEAPAPETIELQAVPVRPEASTGPAWEPAPTIEVALPTQPAAPPAEVEAEVPAAPPVSVWKKEISFRRKPSDPAGPAPVAPSAVPAEPPVSIWKKEISFRRRPDADPHAQHRGDSIWTKEISLRRRQARNEQIRALAEEALRQVDEEEVAAKAVAAYVAQPAPPIQDEAPTVVDVQPEPLPQPAAPEPVAAPEPAPAPPPSPMPVVPPAPVAAIVPVVTPAPAPLPEPVPEAAPAVAAAAVAAAAVVAGEPKVPWWKKEIGPSKKPKAPKEPKGEKKQKKTKEPKAAKEPKEQKPKTRLRDRQLSLPTIALAKRTSSKDRSHTSGNHTVKRMVGLKIGASQIAAARIANNGAAELVQVARQPLERGVVVGGEVRDPEALAEALKLFFTRNKLPRKNVRLGIASNRIGVRTFDLAGIADDKQLENAIRFRAQETLPIPLDEAVLDYHVLGDGVDEEGNPTKRVLLVVAYRELVERYASACKKAGIQLAGVDLEAFALLRALAAPRGEGSGDDSALVAVAIGHDRSTFAVSNGRVCEFTRVIEWGGSTLSVAIARALDLAPSEVEPLKRLVSLESPGVPDGVDHEKYVLAVEAVRRQVQAFARELVSSLQFYQHQPGSLGIGEIVITGGTAGLVGLANELQTLIGVRVRVGDPLARLKVAKKLAPDESIGSYAVAIGLGIED